ncbi:MAG: DsbA family protein [Proteobacteria bacterium]|nr:DsbA family protein [Pseudomonadota bacterium]
MTGRIEKLRQEFDIAVRWRAFPLHPETPEEGQSLKELFRTTPEKVAGMIAHLKTTADKLGLPFGPRTMTYNSRLAQELGMWAMASGKGDEFHLAAFKAYFADGVNLGKIPVLLEIAGSLGLPEKEAAQVLADRTFKDEVDRDWQESRFKGITAVPTFMMGQHKLVGAQDYETLEQLARQNGAVKRDRAT